MHAAIGAEGHLDAGGVPGHRLVDGVVGDLVDEVVKTALPGGADVHARTLANSVEAFEDGDRTGVIGHVSQVPFIAATGSGDPISSGGAVVRHFLDARVSLSAQTDSASRATAISGGFRPFTP